MIFPTSSRQFLIEFVVKNIIFFFISNGMTGDHMETIQTRDALYNKRFQHLGLSKLDISLTRLKDKSDCFKTSILQFYQMFEVNN